MTEKRQTSQDYIIRILQHFATKLWNITNFVMLFRSLPFFSHFVLQTGNWQPQRVLGCRFPPRDALSSCDEIFV
jgi:hypothetical protein